MQCGGVAVNKPALSFISTFGIEMKKLSTFLKILKVTGLVIMGLGISLSLFDLLGWYKDPEKISVLNWATTPGVGMSIEEPGAQKFIKDFPPPSDSNKTVTHLTKNVMKSALGGKAMQVSINYMYSDKTRSAYVANLSDIENWTKKTLYPWIAWVLLCLGFIQILISYILSAMVKNPNNPSNQDA